MPPFLSIADFTAQYQLPMSVGDTAVATRLLQVASDRIRVLAPAADPTAAAQVVFEIVREALLYGEFEPLASFQNVTSHRTEAGEFDKMTKKVNDYLTDRHRRLLGIPLRAAPAYSFPDPNCGFDNPTIWSPNQPWEW